MPDVTVDMHELEASRIAFVAFVQGRDAYQRALDMMTNMVLQVKAGRNAAAVFSSVENMAELDAWLAKTTDELAALGVTV